MSGLWVITQGILDSLLAVVPWQGLAGFIQQVVVKPLNPEPKSLQERSKTKL